MINSCIRKYVAILTLVVSVIIFLPEVLFAQGAVIGYANPNGVNNPNYPSVAQLNKLTHVMAVDIGCLANGNLYFGKNNLPNSWSGYKNYKNAWLCDLVNRAHTKGVKVSICISGDSDVFGGATNSSNLNTFVTNIVDFVDANSIDGVDIDWEEIGLDNHWVQCYNLLYALKNHNNLQCKRISVALPYKHPGTYPRNPSLSGPYVSYQIWDIVDAIHLMTYDEGYDSVYTLFPTHSHANSANAHINNWAYWNDYTLNLGLDNKKLHVACAFYGYNKDGNGNTIWKKVVNGVTVPAHVPYKDGGSTCGNPGDNLYDVESKVNNCYGSNAYNNIYGGVMFWELSYDLADATNPNSLLYKIWYANEAQGGYFPPCTCPTTLTYTTSPAILGLTTVRHEGNIIIQNVTVNNGVTLNVKSCVNGSITVNNVIVLSGGKLILDAGGDVTINEIDVQLGAEFEVL